MSPAVHSLLAFALITAGCGVTASDAPPGPRHRDPDAGVASEPAQSGDDEEPNLEPRDALPDPGSDGGSAHDGGGRAQQPDGSEQQEHGGGGGAGDGGVSPSGAYSCRSESWADGELVVYCAEWTGPEASDLFTFCTSPGTAYRPAPCELDGSVGACAYAVSAGLTIRNVWYADPQSGESSCASSQGTWQPPTAP